jgi:hypothetical protein
MKPPGHLNNGFRTMIRPMDAIRPIKPLVDPVFLKFFLFLAEGRFFIQGQILIQDLEGL